MAKKTVTVGRMNKEKKTGRLYIPEDLMIKAGILFGEETDPYYDYASGEIRFKRLHIPITDIEKPIQYVEDDDTVYYIDEGFVDGKLVDLNLEGTKSVWLFYGFPYPINRAEWMYEHGWRFRDPGKPGDWQFATQMLIETFLAKKSVAQEPVAEPVKPVADEHKELMLSFVSMIKDPKQIGYLEYQCKMFATKNQMEKAELWDLTPEFIVDNFEMDKLSPAFKHYVNGLKMGV